MYVYSTLLTNKKNIFIVDCIKKIDSYKEISQNLINGLIEFHPYFFYTSIIFSVILIIHPVNLNKLRRLFYVKHLLFIFLLSLFSGGYWSFLQLVWGDWWTWDNIELILLFFITIFINISHQFLLKKTYNNFFYTTLFCTNIYYLFLIRFNFFSSKHNFFLTNATATIGFNCLKFIFIFLAFYVVYVIKQTNLIKYKKNIIEICLLCILCIYLISFNILNFFPQGYFNYYLLIIFFYIFYLLKYVLKKNLIYLYHLFLFIIVTFIYFFKVSNIKLNIQKVYFMDLFNYSQYFYMIVFTNFTANQNLETTLHHTNKLTYVKDCCLFNTLNVIFYNMAETLFTNNYIYSKVFTQNKTNIEFNIKKNSGFNLNLYLNTYLYNLALPLYLVLCLLSIVFLLN
jgi:hypothetical protein